MNSELNSEILSIPVLVNVGSGAGSGFFFNSTNRVFLVTALHVLFDPQTNPLTLRSDKITLTYYESDPQHSNPMKLDVDLTKAPIRKNDDKDIALVEIATVDAVGNPPYKLQMGNGVKAITQGARIYGADSERLRKYKDVLVSNDIFILGYPNSLGSTGQINPERPLLRKGIVAGLNVRNQTIILDCPVYFGNSGGVVIQVEVDGANKLFKVIGVVSQLVPFVEELVSRQMGYTNTNMENSGYSIAVPIDTIIELTNESPTAANELLVIAKG